MEDGDYPATNDTRASGSKRSFGDLQDDETDCSGSKKSCMKGEESDTGVEAAMISSLQESLLTCVEDLASCKEDLASCQNELESAKTEVNKWKSAFEKESFVPAGKSPEPEFVIDYIEKVRSSETTLKEQLEIAQMKLAIRYLKSQLKPQPMQEVEVDKNRRLGLETHPRHGDTSSSSSAYPSIPALLEELQAANTLIARLREVQAVDLAEIRKTQVKHAEFMELVLQKVPSLVPPSAKPEDADE